MYSQSLLTFQLISENLYRYDECECQNMILDFFFSFHRASLDYSCIQMYNILSMYRFYTTVFPLISGLRAVALKFGDWNTTVRQTSMATLQRRSVPCKISHLTEDDRKIHVNTGMVELHNALKIGKKQHCHWGISFFLRTINQPRKM